MKPILLSLFMLLAVSASAQEYSETTHQIRCISGDLQTEVDITVGEHQSSFIKLVRITDQDISVVSEYKVFLECFLQKVITVVF